MKALQLFVLLWATWFAGLQTGWAHEMGTSALLLHETETGTGQLIFKRTVGADGKVPPVDFQFEPACELRDLSTEWEDNAEVIQRGRFHCNSALREHSIAANGFTRLAPDLIVIATPMKGERIHSVLNPKQTRIQFDANRSTSASTSITEYFFIGIEHIVFGWDHLLFIAGLYLLWKKRNQQVRQLVGQFTLFTAGHSITLALLVLGWIAVPTRAIEAWIALSVLWLAWELIQKERPQRAQWPHWVLIAAFGLLHGSGFALSMEERGFPQDALLQTLLLFNLGIEVGQLWIVTLMVTAFAIIDRAHFKAFARLAQIALTLGIGGAALYWTVERIHSYV